MKLKLKSIKAFAITVCSLLFLVSFGIGFNGMVKAATDTSEDAQGMVFLDGVKRKGRLSCGRKIFDRYGRLCS